MRKDIVRDTPSLEEFCDYIERKGYDIDPFALYKEFEARDWTTAKGVRTRHGLITEHSATAAMTSTESASLSTASLT